MQPFPFETRAAPYPIATFLEVVGERWSLLVIREASLVRHRFSDIAWGRRCAP
jgi:DNA-binding HxlR family transcriptional regulator